MGHSRSEDSTRGGCATGYGRQGRQRRFGDDAGVLSCWRGVQPGLPGSRGVGVDTPSGCRNAQEHFFSNQTATRRAFDSRKTSNVAAYVTGRSAGSDGPTSYSSLTRKYSSSKNTPGMWTSRDVIRRGDVQMAWVLGGVPPVWHARWACDCASALPPSVRVQNYILAPFCRYLSPSTPCSNNLKISENPLLESRRSRSPAAATPSPPLLETSSTVAVETRDLLVGCPEEVSLPRRRSIIHVPGIRDGLSLRFASDAPIKKDGFSGPSTSQRFPDAKRIGQSP